MTFTEIDVNTYSGNVPTGTDLVVAESGDVEETALVLYGFDEIGMFDNEFNNPKSDKKFLITIDDGFIRELLFTTT